MSRKIKAFSYDEKNQIYFDMLSKEADNHQPKVSDSALLIHILRTHFEHNKMLKKMNMVG